MRGSVDENRFKQIEVGYAKTRVNILDKVKDRILPSSKGSTKMCRDIFR